jgi:hypothetical protein
MCKTLNELNLEMKMEKPVYDFAPLEAVVNDWIRQRIAEESLVDFGKIDSCEIEGAPV